MILLYGSQQDYDVMAGKADRQAGLSAEDVAAMHAFMESFNKDLVDSGELVDARAWPRRCTPGESSCKNGVPVVTDGPYPETQEVLAGYTIVECDSFDRATEIAARVSSAPTRGRAPASTSTCGRSSRASATWSA